MTRASLMMRLRGMSQRNLFSPAPVFGAAGEDPVDEQDSSAAASAFRAESIQRLQIGLFGIGSMVLLVGLASVIGGQADLADQAAVPDAAPTTEPTATPTQSNPLADAGVVPDIAVEPSPSPAPSPLDLPSQRPSGSGSAAPGQ